MFLHTLLKNFMRGLLLWRLASQPMLRATCAKSCGRLNAIVAWPTCSGVDDSTPVLLPIEPHKSLHFYPHIGY